MSSLTIQSTGVEQPFTVLRTEFITSAIITEHPVEQGVDVTDHIQVRPERIKVEAAVSDTRFVEDLSGGVAQAVGWLNQAIGQLLTVTIDNEGVFENYAIESGSHPRSVIAGRKFTLSLKQVRIAQSLRVELPPSRTTSTGAPDESDKGQQSAEQRDISAAKLTKNFLVDSAGDVVRFVGSLVGR